LKDINAHSKSAAMGSNPSPAPGEKPVSADDWYRQTLNKKISLTKEQVGRVVQMAEAIHFDGRPLGTVDDRWIRLDIRNRGSRTLSDRRFPQPSLGRCQDTGIISVVDLGRVKMERIDIY
jgi:hypothetical protein